MRVVNIVMTAHCRGIKHVGSSSMIQIRNLRGPGQ